MAAAAALAAEETRLAYLVHQVAAGEGPALAA
jgi:hypothetical protein